MFLKIEKKKSTHKQSKQQQQQTPWNQIVYVLPPPRSFPWAFIAEHIIWHGICLLSVWIGCPRDILSQPISHPQPTGFEGARGLVRKPKWCATTDQQQTKYWYVTNSSFATNAKHSTSPAATKINFIPARSSTILHEEIYVFLADNWEEVHQLSWSCRSPVLSYSHILLVVAVVYDIMSQPSIQIWNKPKLFTHLSSRSTDLAF